MKTMKTTLAFGIVLLTSFAYGQTPCEIFKKYGYIESTNSYSELQYKRDFLKRYSETEFRSKSESDKFGADAGISIGALAGSFGLDQSNYTVSDFKKKVTLYLNDQLSYNLKQSFESTRINPEVLKIIANCGGNGITGVTQSIDSTEVLLFLDFKESIINQDSSLISRVSVFPEGAATLYHSLYVRQDFPANINEYIKENGGIYAFKRHTTEEFTIALTTNEISSNSTFVIPAVLKPAPEEAKCDLENTRFFVTLKTANVENAESDEPISLIFVGECGTFSKRISQNHGKGKSELHDIKNDQNTDIGELHQVIIEIYKGGDELSDWCLRTIEIVDANRGTSYRKIPNVWLGNAKGSVMRTTITFNEQDL